MVRVVGHRHACQENSCVDGGVRRIGDALDLWSDFMRHKVKSTNTHMHIINNQNT